MNKPLWQPFSSDGENDVRCPFQVFAKDEKEALKQAELFLRKLNLDDVIYNFFCPKTTGECATVVRAVEIVPNELGVIMVV